MQVSFILLGSRRAERTTHRGRRPDFRPETAGYSCGTVLDFHQLPPLRPGIRANGSPRRSTNLAECNSGLIIAQV